MVRPLRIAFEDAVYHITCRGNRRDRIFTCDRDIQVFIEKMDEVFTRFSFNCYAYCLMDNHYHLMVQTPLANISTGLHDLNCSYGNWFRAKYGLVGPLFQGRFKSIVVDADAYAMQLVAYIHLNPVRAGIADHPDDYFWSSHRDYTGSRDPMLSTLDIPFILGQLSMSPTIALLKYRRYLEDNMDMPDPRNNAYRGIALGTGPFIDMIETRIQVGGKKREIPLTRKVSWITPSIIVEAVATGAGEKKKHVLARTRGNSLRKLAIYLSRKLTPLSLREIGEYFDMDYAAVSQASSRLAARLENDPHLQALVTSVENHLMDDY